MFAKNLIPGVALAMISVAHADSATGAARPGFDITQMVPLALFFVVMYFLLIRPQQKRAKEQRDMQSALRRGDRVVTSSGLIGTLAKIDGDTEVQLDLADGVRVTMLKSSILQVMSKPTPVVAEKTEDASAASEKKAKPAAKKTAAKTTKKS
ncbi:MAG: preprotein translocase subunit YajC [Holosporales bacterium]